MAGLLWKNSGSVVCTLYAQALILFSALKALNGGSTDILILLKVLLSILIAEESLSQDRQG